MFQELYEKLKDGEALNVFIKRNEDSTITTSISFRIKDKSYAPVTATGTPEEMDNEFVDVVGAITEKIASAGLKVSTEALDTELKEEPKQTTKGKVEKKAAEPTAKEVEQNLILSIISNAEQAIEANNMDVLTEAFDEIEKAIKADKKRTKQLEAVRQNVMKAQAKIRMDEDEDVDPTEAISGSKPTPTKTPVVVAEVKKEIVIDNVSKDDIDPLEAIQEAEIIEDVDDLPFGGKNEETNDDDDEDITKLFG